MQTADSASNGAGCDGIGAAIAEEVMKNVAWFVGGACLAAVGVLVWNCKRVPAVPELAHQLEEAWADHHTVV